MTGNTDAITITLPRSAVGDVVALSDSLLERMHDLLERNTDGICPLSNAQLETLVQMAQFGQIMSMALQSATKP